MSSPSASIIIPVRDQAEALSACLGAVLKQQYPRDSVELIVVDNGSRAPVE